MFNDPRPEEIDDEALLPTVPWPQLHNDALQGAAGAVVNLVAPHTEADPAALLVQLLAVFGATVGRGPHIKVGNDVHPAILHPVIVGRTSSGAKGTSYGAINAIRRAAVPDFDANIVSGLTSAEGLIELLRDGESDDDIGVTDKRLLVKETEYRSVLSRGRREGNTLAPTLRQAWDGETLRTLARKHNKLIATDPHIVVIGHITPREFRDTLCDTDLSGGSVNRQLICLSRRSRLHSRFGNIPDDVIRDAADFFKEAHTAAVRHQLRQFTDGFWTGWDNAYQHLNRDQPESNAADAMARAVPQVLRLSMIYSLLDQADQIGAQHLRAALALWDYCAHSVRWLFSSHQLEEIQLAGSELARFILSGGDRGRTRTQISNDFFYRNKTAAEINVELAPLVHDGTVIEEQVDGKSRRITRYVHRSLRINESTKNAGQQHNSSFVPLRTNSDTDGDNSLANRDSSYPKTPPDLHDSSNSLIRSSYTANGEAR